MNGSTGLVESLEKKLEIAKKALQELAKHPLYEYGEDDADDLDTLREAAEAAGMGEAGEVARRALQAIG